MLPAGFRGSTAFERFRSLIGERSDVFCLLALCGALYFPGLGERDLWAPVEPRYAEIVRVMFSHNQWVVPTVNGGLYTDKPVLYFWAALLAAHLTGGVTEWAVRLPAALGAVGFVLIIYLIGREFFSARVGVLAAVVLATSFRVIWEARWAHVDMLFGFFFLLTIYFGARSLIQHRRHILLAYVFMALATLTKGLIGIVLPALLVLAFVIVRRDWNLLRKINLPLGIPIFLVLATPWFYLVSRASDGKWLADFLYVHHLQRYTAGSGHRQPFYYYVTTLPVDWLPWTAFLIPAVVSLRWREWWNRPETQFLLLWCAVVLVFFSVSDTKRDLYLLPLFPPLALLLACYLNELARQHWAERRWYFWLALFCMLFLALAGIALPSVAWIARRDVFWPVLSLGAVLAVSGAITALLMIRRKTFAVVLCVATMMLGITHAVAYSFFPYLERFKSHRAFSAEINRLVPRSAPLYVYQDTTEDFNYYTQREIIPVLDTAADISRAGAGGEQAYLLIKQRALGRLSEIPAGAVIAHRTLGSTTWYLMVLE